MIEDKAVDELFGPTFGAMAKKLGLPLEPEEEKKGKGQAEIAVKEKS